LGQILSTDAAVVVYCKNRECDDALLLSLELREMGKSNLLYYVDGFELWEESGCPVEKNRNHEIHQKHEN
jgi:rhodanese-related sulfurtransferase